MSYPNEEGPRIGVRPAQFYKSCSGCEQLLTEINYIRDVEIKALEVKIQDGCNVINELYDILKDDTLVRNGTDLHFAEAYLHENYVPAQKELNDIEDDLPF